MTDKVITIGTRGSDLALWQANYLKNQLKENCGLDAKLQIIQTTGDKITDLSFDKIEGKGFFTKELEEALLEGDIDVAVHSMKDMPTSSPAGLCLAAVSYREDSRDVLLIHSRAISDDGELSLVKKAVVGTSSVRRKSQILHLRPDITVNDLRGNVPTRIGKLKNGDYDAIILAQAGINRLSIDMQDIKCIALHPAEFVPAPAQGVLAYQCRHDDLELRKTLMQLHNYDVAECTNVERKILKMMDGGCHIPLGVHCSKDANGYYHVHAAYSKGLEHPLIKIRKSQSTIFNLAELVAGELINYKQ
jgi:hydroxymethylbilane synthase